jgi:hypothetical protein
MMPSPWKTRIRYVVLNLPRGIKNIRASVSIGVYAEVDTKTTPVRTVKKALRDAVINGLEKRIQEIKGQKI